MKVFKRLFLLCNNERRFLLLKEYMIWFKSGNSISGVADEDGTTIIDLSQIEAISINNCSENNNIGFNPR